jgi:hypothetical protein
LNRNIAKRTLRELEVTNSPLAEEYLFMRRFWAEIYFTQNSQQYITLNRIKGLKSAQGLTLEQLMVYYDCLIHLTFQ